MTRRKRGWSYNAGSRGRNWVRAYHNHRGLLMLEWFEESGEVAPETGKPVLIRRRGRLKGEQTEDHAMAKADEMAAAFAQLDRSTAAQPDLSRLIRDYIQEVTPTKSKEKQGHDRRAARVWLAFFGAQLESARRTARLPESLDRLDWDRFSEWRRAGKIPGWAKAVRNRQVQYDLKWMIAVLNWGAGTRVPGGEMLYVAGGVSPWRAEVRRSQRWVMPREKSPHRPGMTDAVREALIPHAPSWQFELAMVLERDTRRRNSAIRRLRWSDIDQESWEIRWRGEFDKDDRETVTPLLSKQAIEALKKAPSRGIGEAPVFPSGSDVSKATPRHTFQTWLRRAKMRFLKTVPAAEREAWRERLRGVGFHAEKRAGVREREFRQLPPKMQERISGTSYATLRTVYDDVTADEIRQAYRAKRAEGGVS